MAYKYCEGEDYRFLGLVSSDYAKDEVDYFREKVEKDVGKDTNVIYIYNGENPYQSSDYLTKSKDFIAERRLFDVKDLIVDEGLEKEKFLNLLEGYMSESDRTRNNLVYMTIDESWTSLNGQDIRVFHDQLRSLGEKMDHRFVIRYILSELDQAYIKDMMMEHEYLLMRQGNDFNIFRSKDLVKDSLTMFPVNKKLEENYHREVVKSEHLKSVGELTQGMVHDVNNLLATILGSVELIIVNGYNNDNADYLKTIYKTACDGSTIMNRVRSYMKGLNTSEKEVHFLDNIVDFCVEMSTIKLRNLSQDKKVELDMTLNSKAYIKVNEYEIRQSILNIIFNAIDAMPKGGSLEIDTYDQDNYAVLLIKDSGVGMSQEGREKMFDAYYSTKGNKGTGIGLKMAKSIFDDHKIGVEVETELDKGTEFKIKFPIERLIEDRIGGII